MLNLNISGTSLRYLVNLGSLAIHMLAILSLNADVADAVSFGVYSLIIGLYLGDCNTLNFYRRHPELCNSLILPERSLLTLVGLFVIYLLGVKASFTFVSIGIVIGLFLPQGIVSGRKIYEKVIFCAGFAKLSLSGSLVIFNIYDVAIIQLLLCLSTGSVYLAIFYFLVIERVSKLQLLTFSFSRMNSLMYSALISAPIQIYTSIGAIIYNTYNDNPQLGIYYQTERVVRGLGATVLVLQAKTMSELSDVKAFDTAMKKATYFLFVYSIYSAIISILFCTIGQYILYLLEISLFDFTNYNMILIAMSTIAMYQSNLLGIQLFSVYKKTLAFVLSVSMGAFAFVIFNNYVTNPLSLIALSEAVVAITQIMLLLISFYRLNLQDKPNY